MRSVANTVSGLSTNSTGINPVFLWLNFMLRN